MDLWNSSLSPFTKGEFIRSLPIDWYYEIMNRYRIYCRPISYFNNLGIRDSDEY
jgi:hypothetical protein